MHPLTSRRGSAYHQSPPPCNQRAVLGRENEGFNKTSVICVKRSAFKFGKNTAVTRKERQNREEKGILVRSNNTKYFCIKFYYRSTEKRKGEIKHFVTLLYKNETKSAVMHANKALHSGNPSVPFSLKQEVEAAAAAHTSCCPAALGAAQRTAEVGPQCSELLSERRWERFHCFHCSQCSQQASPETTGAP